MKGLVFSSKKVYGELTDFLENEGIDTFFLEEERNLDNKLLDNLSFELCFVDIFMDGSRFVINRIKKVRSFKNYVYIFGILKEFNLKKYLKLVNLNLDDFIVYPFNKKEFLNKLKRAKSILDCFSKSYNLYHYFFKKNLNAVILFDNDCNIIDVNQSAIKLLETKYNNIVNKKIYNVIDFNKNKFINSINCNNKRKKILIETKVSNKIKYLDIKINNIILDKKLYHFACIADITKVKNIQDKLKNIIKENEMLINAINSILIYLDKNYTIYKWNKEAERVFGLSRKEVLGLNMKELSLKWELDDLLKRLINAKEEKREQHLSDIDFIDSSGKVKIVAMTIYPVFEPTGFKGYLILGKDITEKKIIESHIIHSQKLEAIGQLAAGIAHEINTPVQYVYGNLSYLKDNFLEILKLLEKYKTLLSRLKRDHKDFPEMDLFQEISALENNLDIEFLKEDIPNALQESVQGLDKVIQIVKSMKNFAHSGKKKKVFDVNKAIRDIVTITRNEWKYHSEVELELDENLPLVCGYADELNQVILNIVVNAAQAITEKVETLQIQDKGLIFIKTNVKDNMVEIQIKDTGGGIPKEIQDKIFDPFFTTKEVGKGTGQGLYLSYNIIKRHNGDIFFETEEGKGTTFHILLPIAPEDHCKEEELI